MRELSRQMLKNIEIIANTFIDTRTQFYIDKESSIKSSDYDFCFASKRLRDETLTALRKRLELVWYITNKTADRHTYTMSMDFKATEKEMCEACYSYLQSITHSGMFEYADENTESIITHTFLSVLELWSRIKEKEENYC